MMGDGRPAPQTSQHLVLIDRPAPFPNFQGEQNASCSDAASLVDDAANRMGRRQRGPVKKVEVIVTSCWQAP